jgi:hypothetical protein
MARNRRHILRGVKATIITTTGGMPCCSIIHIIRT